MGDRVGSFHVDYRYEVEVTLSLLMKTASIEVLTLRLIYQTPTMETNSKLHHSGERKNNINTTHSHSATEKQSLILDTISIRNIIHSKTILITHNNLHLELTE